jgi:hypothetical protein
MKYSSRLIFKHSVLLCPNPYSTAPGFYCTPALYFSCLGILLTYEYIHAARTRITENTCHVMATQPVHWRVGCCLQKTHHVTAVRPVHWVAGCCLTVEITLPSAACLYFGRGSEMDVLLLLRASRSLGVYQAVA